MNSILINSIYIKKIWKKKKVGNKFFSKYNNNYIKRNFKTRKFQYNLCL